MAAPRQTLDAKTIAEFKKKLNTQYKEYLEAFTAYKKINEEREKAEKENKVDGPKGFLPEQLTDLRDKFFNPMLAELKELEQNDPDNTLLSHFSEKEKHQIGTLFYDSAINKSAIWSANIKLSRTPAELKATTATIISIINECSTQAIKWYVEEADKKSTKTNLNAWKKEINKSTKEGIKSLKELANPTSKPFTGNEFYTVIAHPGRLIIEKHMKRLSLTTFIDPEEKEDEQTYTGSNSFMVAAQVKGAQSRIVTEYLLALAGAEKSLFKTNDNPQSGSDFYGFNPATLAARAGNHVFLEQALEKLTKEEAARFCNFANIGGAYPGSTPLMFAAGNGSLETAKILLKFGAKLTALTDKSNPRPFWTASQFAILERHEEMITFLNTTASTLAPASAEAKTEAKTESAAATAPSAVDERPDELLAESATTPRSNRPKRKLHTPTEPETKTETKTEAKPKANGKKKTLKKTPNDAKSAPANGKKSPAKKAVSTPTATAAKRPKPDHHSDDDGGEPTNPGFESPSDRGAVSPGYVSPAGGYTRSFAPTPRGSEAVAFAMISGTVTALRNLIEPLDDALGTQQVDTLKVIFLAMQEQIKAAMGQLANCQGAEPARPARPDQRSPAAWSSSAPDSAWSSSSSAPASASPVASRNGLSSTAIGLGGLAHAAAHAASFALTASTPRRGSTPDSPAAPFSLRAPTISPRLSPPAGAALAYPSPTGSAANGSSASPKVVRPSGATAPAAIRFVPTPLGRFGTLPARNTLPAAPAVAPASSGTLQNLTSPAAPRK